MRIALTANETYSVNLNKEQYRKFNKHIRVVWKKTALTILIRFCFELK